MKTITIRLSDVEAARLLEVQKRNQDYKDLEGCFRGSYAKNILS